MGGRPVTTVPGGSKRIKKTVLAVLAVLLIAPFGLAGCAEKSPEGALNGYLSAWQDSDWTAFKESVAPQKRKLSEVQEELAKQKFKQVKVKLDGIKMTTEYDKKDRNKAVVTLTDGKITYTAKVLGENKTETQDIGKMPEKERPYFGVVKVDGTWYVDMDLG